MYSSLNQAEIGIRPPISALTTNRKRELQLMAKSNGTAKRACTVDGCERKAYCRGWCRKHYSRWQAHGDPEKTLRACPGDLLKFVEDMLSRDLPNECVEWPFTKTDGYGILVVDGRKWQAHRYALYRFTCIDPEDKVAAHGPCHNRACVNPKHVSWKTVTENNGDKLRDGTNCMGESNASSKLSEPEVIEIFQDSRRQGIIAADHNISQSLVSLIKLRKSWAWLTEDLIQQ